MRIGIREESEKIPNRHHEKYGAYPHVGKTAGSGIMLSEPFEGEKLSCNRAGLDLCFMDKHYQRPSPFSS
jgi:hypothetical protein